MKPNDVSLITKQFIFQSTKNTALDRTTQKALIVQHVVKAKTTTSQTELPSANVILGDCSIYLSEGRLEIATPSISLYMETIEKELDILRSHVESQLTIHSVKAFYDHVKANVVATLGQLLHCRPTNYLASASAQLEESKGKLKSCANPMAFLPVFNSAYENKNSENFSDETAKQWIALKWSFLFIELLQKLSPQDTEQLAQVCIQLAAGNQVKNIDLSISGKNFPLSTLLSQCGLTYPSTQANTIVCEDIFSINYDPDFGRELKKRSSSIYLHFLSSEEAEAYKRTARHINHNSVWQEALTAQDLNTPNTLLKIQKVLLDILWDEQTQRHSCSEEQADQFSAALEENDLAAAETLTRSTDFKNYTDVLGNPALHIAAINGSYEVVQLLLDRGYRPFQLNHDNLLPSEVAYQSGCLDTAILLEAPSSTHPIKIHKLAKKMRAEDQRQMARMTELLDRATKSITKAWKEAEMQHITVLKGSSVARHSRRSVARHSRSSVARHSRSSAANALGEIAKAGGQLNENAIAALVAVLKDSSVDGDARRFAANALGEITKAGGQLNENAIAALVAFLKDSSVHGHAQRLAANALGETAKAGGQLNENAIAALVAFLKDSSVHGHARSSAANALGEIAKAGGQLSENAIAALVAFLKDSSVDGDARSSAANALGKIAKAGGQLNENAIAALVAFLKDSSVHGHARRLAANALGEIAKAGGQLNENAIAALVAFLKDSSVDGHAQRLAANALGEIAKAGGKMSENAIAALVAVLKDSSVDGYARRLAANALGEIPKAGGQLNENAIAALVAFLKDSSVDGHAQSSAANALGEITKAGGKMNENDNEALSDVLKNQSLDRGIPVSFQRQAAGKSQKKQTSKSGVFKEPFKSRNTKASGNKMKLINTHAEHSSHLSKQ